MKLLRIVGMAAGLVLVLVWTGCGDTYRPVATPIAPGGGSPQAQRVAVVVYESTPTCTNATTCTCPAGNAVANSTAPCGPGLTSQIDVSGDVDMADVKVGVLGPAPGSVLSPPSGSTPNSGFTQNFVLIATEGLYAANNVDSTISEFPSFTPGATATIIGSASGSQPVAMVESVANSTIYVANLDTQSVSAISESTNASVTAQPLSVGVSPVALVATVDGTKVYVANRDPAPGAPSPNGSVSVITSADNAVNANTGGNITVGVKPIRMVSNSLGSEIYVLNQGDGTGTNPPSISVIDPSLDSVVGTIVQSTNFSAVSPNYMIFDSHLQRLYVSDPVAGKVFVFDASQTGTGLPVWLKTITVSGQPGALSLLADGSRVYFVNFGATSTCQVEIISSASNTVTNNCLTLPLGAVSWLAVSGDGSKVYATELGGTSIISTATNAVVNTIAAPANLTPVYVVSE
jgi:DNA-binding beta-propeller fold protein YncE